MTISTSRRGFLGILSGFVATLHGRVLPGDEIERAAEEWDWSHANLAEAAMPAVLTSGQISERFLERLHDGLQGVRRAPMLNVNDIRQARFGLVPGVDTSILGVDLQVTKRELSLPLDSFDERYIYPAALCVAGRIEGVDADRIRFGELDIPGSIDMGSRSTNEKSGTSVRVITGDFPWRDKRLLRKDISLLRFDVLVTKA